MNADKPLHCNCCGKRQREVESLIAPARNGLICNRCVGLLRHRAEKPAIRRQTILLIAGFILFVRGNSGGKGVRTGDRRREVKPRGNANACEARV